MLSQEQQVQAEQLKNITVHLFELISSVAEDIKVGPKNETALEKARLLNFATEHLEQSLSLLANAIQKEI